MINRNLAPNYFWMFLCILSLFLLRCHKPNERNDSKLNSERIGNKELNYFYSTSRLANGHYICGDTVIGSRTDTGYYLYPSDTLDFGTSPANTLVQITVNSLNNPNNFSVYDRSGNLVVSSGWMGTANYSGPWGSSLNTPSTQTLAFVRGSQAIYVLKIETYFHSPADTFNAIISCTTLSGGGIGDTGCVCGKTVSGSYASSGYHSYANVSINLACSQSGKTITLNCDPLNQPNRFTIYDISGNVVVSTGWTGSASYSGPWGMSLNNPGAHSISFSRSANSTYYTLKVETSSQTGSDTWSSSITCQP